VDFISPQALKLLGHIRAITFSFTTMDSLLTLYFALVISRFEYASVSWNTLTSSEASKLARIQRVFSVVLQSFLSTNSMWASYVSALDRLNSHTLCSRGRHLYEFFLVNVYNGFKCFLPYSKLLEFAFVFEIVETFLCLLLFYHIKVVRLLELHQSQIPFAKIPMYLAIKWLHLMQFKLTRYTQCNLN
jgi:hypothetical protein